jgi:chitinase
LTVAPRRIFIALFLTAGSLPLPAQTRLLAYYPMWAKTQTPPYSAAQIPYRKMTHIAHAFLAINPKADGGISIDPSLLEPALISGAHAAGVKVLISIGGADPAQAPAFSTVAKSDALRKTFARNVHNFVTANGYDGVDIDWEVPNAPADTQPCILLMQALRAEMPSPGFLLSMAIGANPPGYGTGFDVPSLAPILDFINVMTYDFHGPWSNHAGHNAPMILNMSDPGLEGSLTISMDLFEKTYGVPRQKLNFGTAFYGYDFEGAKSLWDVCNCGKTTTSVNYGTGIKQRINRLGWKSHFDNVAQAPYLLYEGSGQGPGFVTYDDAGSTSAKTTLVLGARKMGGMFMWDLSADFDGSTQDLLDAMYRAFVSARGPQFTAAGVTNGASFAHGISPGEIATIFGVGLGTGQGVVEAGSVPLPVQLLTTTVTVGGVAAPLFAVDNVNGSEQINFQVPWEIAAQASVPVVVTNNGVGSQPVQVTVRASQPGVFTVDGVNAVAVHGANQQPVSASSPVVAGEVIVLYATGLGPVKNQPRTGSPALSTDLSTTTFPTSVTIAGNDAQVMFSGLTPGYAGLYQVNLTVPPNVDSGVQDLVVTVDGAPGSAVKIAVR